MRARLLGVAALIYLDCTSVARATTYTLTDLGTLGPSNINNAGKVVGSSQQQAAVWNGHIITLSSLGGSQSQARSINSAGQVVGVSGVYVKGVEQQHATIWTGGVPTDLGTLGGGTSYAQSINDAGQVVGASNTHGDVASHAVIWNGGTITDLGTLGGNFSTARSINNAGQVVGYASTTGNAYTHATLWNGTTPTDLGTLGGESSQAFSVNNTGQVVGTSATPGDIAWHATLWNINTNTITDLGSLGGTSFAFAINDAGQVVGWSGDVFDSRATLWIGGIPIDLNTLLDSSGEGWTLTAAYSINFLGQIVGIGRTMPLPVGSGSVTYRGFLLTPVSEVPLPAALPLFATGLGMLGLLGWRRKRKAAPLVV
jgi:probable HAF family extracellular repeat protein